MRVLLISHTCQSRTEGQPKARLLSRIEGMQLRVIVPDRWKHYGAWRRPQVPDPAEFDCRVVKVRWPWLGPAQSYLHSYPSLAAELLDFAPDIIDVWEEPWSRVSAQVCRLRDRLLPKARIVIETEQNINKTLPPPFEGFRRFTLARADYAVARNTEAAGVLRAKGFRGPIQVVPNGVDAGLFNPMDRGQCRRQLHLDGFVVGYVGRLVEAKGVMDLLEAVARCPADVRLLVVGDGPLAGPLGRRGDELGLGQRLRIVARLPLEDLPVVMNALDVLVLPSRTTERWKEQFGRVIIEAHACGTPVIGTESGAIPEVLGQGGLLVAQRNPTALAAAIGRLGADPGLARRMGELGAGQVAQRYAWPQVARLMHEVYLKTFGSAADVLEGAAW